MIFSNLTVAFGGFQLFFFYGNAKQFIMCAPFHFVIALLKENENRKSSKE